MELKVERPSNDSIRLLWIVDGKVRAVEEASEIGGLFARILNHPMKVTADWPVDFGKARNAKSKVIKAIEQYPKT